MSTNITATLTVTDAGSERDGQYQSSYQIALYADGRQIGRVGDVLAAVEGWALGAWLRPGAHQDIDGSGLALWGDSQPGGWSAAHSDGAFAGRPSVATGPCDSADDPITVDGGEGAPAIAVFPADIPEWAAAVAELARLTASDEADDEAVADAWDAAEARALGIRKAIVDAIADAIDGVADNGLPAEPTADEVLANLDGECQDCLEWGDYQGAGPVIAWRDSDGEAQFRWWPDESDIREAIAATVAPTLVERILGDLSSSD